MYRTILKIKAIQIFVHGLFIYGIFIGTPNDWLIAIAIYFFLQVFAVGIGLHRLFSHRSFETYRIVEIFLAFLTVFIAVGSPLTWASVHRQHHMNADKESDPHSPKWVSLWSLMTSSWYKNIKIVPRHIKDLLADPWQVFIHKNYFVIIGFYILSLSLFGLKALVFGFGVPVLFVFYAINLGIILNHKIGYRNFETPDQSTNSIFVSLYTLGEGWHNNHHQDPDNWKHGHNWWELDPPALIIRALQKRKTKVCVA